MKYIDSKGQGYKDPLGIVTCCCGLFIPLTT